MKTTEEMIEVMKAYKEGKIIEALSLLIIGSEWKQDSSPKWTWGLYDYRVKPENMYMPYDDVNEVEFRWVKSKTLDIVYAIDGISYKDNSVHVATEGWFNMQELFKYFITCDGKPCGNEVIHE